MTLKEKILSLLETKGIVENISKIVFFISFAYSIILLYVLGITTDNLKPNIEIVGWAMFPALASISIIPALIKLLEVLAKKLLMKEKKY